MSEISVVIPAYNEQDSIGVCIAEVRKVLRQLDSSAEIIVVDDGSADATWQRLCELTAQSGADGGLRALRFSRNFGKEAAITAGLSAARGRAVIVMDGDLQHPPLLIAQMVEVWRRDKVAIVEALKESRQQESPFQRFCAQAFYFLFNRSTQLDLQRSTDFKLLDRQVVDHYLNLHERIRFFRGLTAWLGFPAAQIRFTPPPRKFGGSRWNLAALVRFSRASLISFTVLPLHLMTWIGLFGLIGSLILGIQTLWKKLAGHAVEGFATVILVQLIIGSLLVICMGLIGEYLAAIYQEIKRRPPYIIRETAGANPDSPPSPPHDA